jgi:hypothetical protein
MSWPYLSATFLFGAFTAYQDIDNFFSSQRVGHLGYKHLPSVVFLIFNGFIAAGFLFWALNTGPESPINKILQVESIFGKTLVVGLAVPSLLRSRLFGDGKQAVGVATAYDWVRDKVLHSLNSYAAEVKDRSASAYAARLKKRKELPERLKGWVVAEVKPFHPEWLPEIEQEFARCQARLSEPDYSYERYLRDLIRWAMDIAGILPIEKRLKREK